jgi:serine protease inhibitor
MNIYNIFSFLLLLVTLTSCQQESIETNEIKTIELDEKSAELIEADNTFGLDIFQKIREESDEENIMVSPFSISVALAMVYNGAEGETKTEMQNTLHLSGLTPEEINASYKMLINALQNLDKDAVLKITNAIFYKNGFSVKPDFLATNKEYYDAEVDDLDFNAPSSVETINSWVAEKTNNKIIKIIETLSPDDRMVLLNAIYFNGIWSRKFDEDGTQARNFRKLDGSNNEIPMMNKEDALNYSTNSLFQAIEIPYGNGNYNMVILLPQEGNNSQNIIDELSVENWKNWTDDFAIKNNVVVTMPRFKFSYEFQLNDVLKKMGMQKAFSEIEADFSGITNDEDLYISSVLHKSFIDVNENGTEAAAVTAVTMTTMSAGPSTPQKIYFTVDKPFVFAITEKDTDAILFIGEVQNPEYEE